MPLSPKVKVTLSTTNHRPEDNDLTSARGRTELFQMQKMSVQRELDQLVGEKRLLIHTTLKKLLKIQQFENKRIVRMRKREVFQEDDVQDLGVNSENEEMEGIEGMEGIIGMEEGDVLPLLTSEGDEQIKIQTSFTPTNVENEHFQVVEHPYTADQKSDQGDVSFRQEIIRSSSKIQTDQDFLRQPKPEYKPEHDLCAELQKKRQQYI